MTTDPSILGRRRHIHYGCGACRPYPAYKDSGVEWLGKIPAHWEVKQTFRWIIKCLDVVAIPLNAQDSR